MSIIRMNAVTGVADTLRPDSLARILDCPAVSPDGRWVAVHYEGEDSAGGYLSGIYLLPLSGDRGHLLSIADEYPLGWLNAHAVLVARGAPADSTAVWLYDLAGKRSRLGTFNAQCVAHAPLSPGRSEIVCEARRWATDVWIADDFDPYFRPPAVPKRP
jgi:hypothetical protein